MFEPECKLLYSEMSDVELDTELKELVMYTKSPVYTKDIEIEYHIEFLKNKINFNNKINNHEKSRKSI